MRRATPVTSEHLAELERTLRWHFPRLHRELLPGHPFSDSHLAVAGHLRVLLCDHKYPQVLLTYARARGIPLTVYAPNIGQPPKGGQILVAWSAKVASWDPVPDFGFLPVDAETYLNRPIGVVQYDPKMPSKAFTPREIINWVANTEGVSHFNYTGAKSPVHRKFRGVPEDGVAVPDAHLRNMLNQIGVWALQAIEHVVPREPPLVYAQSPAGD